LHGRRLRILGIALGLVLLAPTGLAAPSEKPRHASVPEGARVVLASPLVVDELDVLGTLLVALQPGEGIQAGSVHVGPQGAILGLDGKAGEAAQGRDARGSRGSDGHDVIVLADSLAVEPGGRIVAGSGGRGGDAEGWGITEGGAGGKGGSVAIRARLVRDDGTIWPGSGGAGGSATQEADAQSLPALERRALGGRGGDTGSALLNGEDLPIVAPQELLRPRTFAAVEPPLSCSPEAIVGSLPDPPAGGQGGAACMRSEGAPGASGQNCTGTSAGTGGDGGAPAEAVARGGRGGDGIAPGAKGGNGGEAMAIARGGQGGAGGSCTTNVPGTGAPGGIGGDADARATGGEGGSGGLLGAWGGAGGCAYAEAKGGAGGAGGSAITTGGGAGNGGEANALAEGGEGGAGDAGAGRGGNGGCSLAFGAGGRGGHGGDCTPGCPPHTGGLGGERREDHGEREGRQRRLRARRGQRRERDRHDRSRGRRWGTPR